jgi:hypothetical protein
VGGDIVAGRSHLTPTDSRRQSGARLNNQRIGAQVIDICCKRIIQSAPQVFVRLNGTAIYDVNADLLKSS